MTSEDNGGVSGNPNLVLSLFTEFAENGVDDCGEGEDPMVA
jgi:hypothetical protein